MSYSLVTTDVDSHLLCVTDGQVNDADALIEWALDVVSKAQESGVRKLLLDNRTFALNLSPLDVVTFANSLEKMDAAQLGFRMAVLSSPGNKEISHLVETTLTNRSASYKMHSNLNDAKKWLRV